MSFLKKLFSPKRDQLPQAKTLHFSEGDIFFIQNGEKVHVFKVLVWDSVDETYHVLTYEPMTRVPTEADLESLEIAIYHSPFSKDAFPGAVLLANRNITAAELIGYHEYLRQMLPPNDWIAVAKAYYKEAYYLTDAKKHAEAIDAYSKAIDLFPQFYEAIDNRAFCKMDLGQWQEAIEDFRLSLKENPNSFLAEFSIGECYFKMGDDAAAKSQFEIALQIEPEHKLAIGFLQKVNARLGS